MSQRWSNIHGHTHSYAHTYIYILRGVSYTLGSLEWTNEFDESSNPLICCFHHFHIWVYLLRHTFTLPWNHLPSWAICGAQAYILLSWRSSQQPLPIKDWLTVGWPTCWLSTPGAPGSFPHWRGRVTLSFQLMERESQGTFVTHSAGLQNMICVCVAVCV